MFAVLRWCRLPMSKIINFLSFSSSIFLYRCRTVLENVIRLDLTDTEYRREKKKKKKKISFWEKIFAKIFFLFFFFFFCILYQLGLTELHSLTQYGTGIGTIEKKKDKSWLFCSWGSDTIARQQTIFLFHRVSL